MTDSSQDYGTELGSIPAPQPSERTDRYALVSPDQHISTSMRQMWGVFDRNRKVIIAYCENEAYGTDHVYRLNEYEGRIALLQKLIEAGAGVLENTYDVLQSLTASPALKSARNLFESFRQQKDGG